MQILHITDGIFLSGNTQISNVRFAGRNNNSVKPLTEQVRRTADFGGQVKGDKITVENKRPVYFLWYRLQFHPYLQLAFYHLHQVSAPCHPEVLQFRLS